MHSHQATWPFNDTLSSLIYEIATIPLLIFKLYMTFAFNLLSAVGCTIYLKHCRIYKSVELKY